jgi:chaperonin GroEL (HSP60 family)
MSPVFIMGEDASRARGRDAQGSNVAAGKAIAESVRTTLGPRGMDKMLVDTDGNVVITNDGVTILDEGGVVPGAGMTEIRVSSVVRDAAAGIQGRQQLAVEAFADALDALPRTLAANAGMDPIDALVDLRAANESGRAGIIGDGETGRVDDPVEAGVLDPAAVKREAVDAATEAATMIVRIDDIIAAQ